MAMWTRGFKNCSKPSVRTYGECILCDRHLCAQHLGPEYNTCPKWEMTNYTTLLLRKQKERKLATF
ncbi:uncharacterized protein ASPGLDRAFT_398011 [Aspergillus glaucus CBS 516.65]|uniref:AN1-type domain-containing protein n=1 Tax=Aspergillus glaucus CBS 516.65 TaxID=1160497 RepID=A0A1L9VHQ4_ASPGL|nr:hypothetical protein ASPGLDRAFT_398011 [Aspergillus glaucus CBS 516.65]OJJ83413.1 hypothetical protein ASPGLDRAFT_398011 [Aspergillus glaucus CBS 516.65]